MGTTVSYLKVISQDSTGLNLRMLNEIFR